jgi:hypothetical protein
MKIDFPEATKSNPTQCLALAIEQTKINNTLQFLNERYPKEGNDQFWHLNYQNYYYNNVELATTINKLIKECMSTSITKDALVDLTLQELLVRIIQTQTAKSIDDGLFADPNTPISQVLDYIRVNLRENHAQNLSEKVLYEHHLFYRFSKENWA